MMKPTQKPDENTQAMPAMPCKECQAGMMRLKYITFFTWLEEELVTVPNFPAWICDVCGRREYDERAVSWLKMLLNPNAGKTDKKPRHVPLPQKPQEGTRPLKE